jgi:RNA polymerase sigma-70 factor, ECF subfamily
MRALPDAIRLLIERCLAGDQAAMVELVNRYRNQVYGLCLRMLGQRQDAEDAAQETFVRALRSLSRWDAQRDFEPWLLAIAGNRCRTALAARQRRPAVAVLDEAACADRAPDVEAARNLAEEVQLALGGLRVEYRAAFLLFHEHELSYDEIAESLNRPLGTIKTWIRRARRELIDRLRRRDVVQESRHELRRV